jgi:uncharacterized membrane protein
MTYVLPSGVSMPTIRPRRGAVWSLLLGLFLIAGGPASATPEYTLPTLFQVTGVAVDDVLNIRAAPRSSAPIIGTLSPRARNIEVVGYDASGQWARVNSGESSGWAALRYLAYQTDVWTAGALPPSLHCGGTEPFWSLGRVGGAVMFATPDLPDIEVRIDQVLTTGAHGDPRRTVLGQGAGQDLTAVMVPMECSDGMSDRAYGLDVTLILQGQGAARMLTGCCSIAP